MATPSFRAPRGSTSWAGLPAAIVRWPRRPSSRCCAGALLHPPPRKPSTSPCRRETMSPPSRRKLVRAFRAPRSCASAPARAKAGRSAPQMVRALVPATAGGALRRRLRLQRRVPLRLVRRRQQPRRSLFPGRSRRPPRFSDSSRPAGPVSTGGRQERGFFRASPQRLATCAGRPMPR